MFGGWRIVKTMGQKITKLKPVGGFCAETGGAITLFLATALGIPVSTTHTITGAIVGVGSVRRAAAVRWGVAGNIVWAWIFTIPASAFVAGVFYCVSFLLVQLIAGARLEVALRGEGDRRHQRPTAPTASATMTPMTSSQPRRTRGRGGAVPRGPALVGRQAVDDRLQHRRRQHEAEQRHQQRSRARSS